MKTKDLSLILHLSQPLRSNLFHLLQCVGHICFPMVIGWLYCFNYVVTVPSTAMSKPGHHLVKTE